jgi:glycosyltransferase involved in cell wall biosynthesis
MNIVLILMIRNESKIIARCLKAVENIVNAFCVHDTGSSDNTCDLVAEFLVERTGCLTTSEWKNFGHNRTLSFQNAQTYVRDTLHWNLADTYGLLLDADMVFHPGDLHKQTLTEKGYTIIQQNSTLEYPNCRLVRMDHDWVCRGVTHEYWDGPTQRMSKDICWIEDKNDGGCKSDKFERDARLLEDGIEKEPANVRYMFYLAQTYHCLGRDRDAIPMYKRRFRAGGWEEERWYSLYMIGTSYLNLKDTTRFEKYMNLAYEFRPSRAESLYKLSKYFREKGDHYKSYHYLRMGKKISLPTDSLFIEMNVYTDLFDYEETICLYYLNQKREGLRKSLEYMLQKKENLTNVYTNLEFYVEPISNKFNNHPVQRDLFGRDFHPSSVSTLGDMHMVRFVNYSITNTGSYEMKNGNYSSNHTVRTRNGIWNTDGRVVFMDDATITLPRRPHRITGIEDVRIYTDGNNRMRFVATSCEFSENIRILTGELDVEKGAYRNTIVVQSPLDAGCEKNWIPVNGTHDILYSWNPLRVGHLEDDTLKIDKEIKTPWFFQHLRGSAVPIMVQDELWCLVHYVKYSTPRKYFHCIVVLDPTTYVPKRISLPFVFRDHGIEYCLSMTQQKNDIEFIFSSWDDNPTIVRVHPRIFEWVHT